ncbi:MAG: hypothetical protein PUP92_18505 [Rhizonema sp. PD38]|nr:hypothetical protein [Rhizonema sp. PD38]
MSFTFNDTTCGLRESYALEVIVAKVQGVPSPAYEVASIQLDLFDAFEYQSLDSRIPKRYG